MNRSFSVGRGRVGHFGNNLSVPASRYVEKKDRRGGVKKIIQEIQERKEKGLGDLTSLYLERGYNKQRNMG